MVALGLDKHGFCALKPVDHGEDIRIGSTFLIQYAQVIKGVFRFRQVVHPVTGTFTLTASDTFGDIMKHAKALGPAGELLAGRAQGRIRNLGGLSQCRGSETSDKFSSGNTHNQSSACFISNRSISLFFFMADQAVRGRDRFDAHFLVTSHTLAVIRGL